MLRIACRILHVALLLVCNTDSMMLLHRVPIGPQCFAECKEPTCYHL
jgi:hypothetical protein